VWAIIAPFIAMAMAFVGFTIRPVRMYFSSLVSQVLGRPSVETGQTGDADPALDPPDDEEGEPR